MGGSRDEANSVSPPDCPMLKIVNRPLPGLGPSYGPPGEGPFPTVMVLHGSEGAWSGFSHLTAAIIAG
jgi:hypothetical protein